MEITAEITNEEYEQVIRDYYINKDWTKYIAILALIALGLSLFSVSYDGWRVLYGYFDVYFFVLFLFFFILPYSIYYIQMRIAVRANARQREKWIFNINETGISVGNSELVRYYRWFEINKVRQLEEYIIIKPASGNLLCLPIRFLQDQDADSFLAMIRYYRTVPVNRAR